MAQKIIGLYNEGSREATACPGQLIIEISNYQVACLVKNNDTGEVIAFELFQLEEIVNDWNDLFYEIRQYSFLLSKTYTGTHLYYNFEEAILIPEQQTDTMAANDYLSLVFGNSDRHDVHYDIIEFPGRHITNAYRVRRSIHELAGKYFVAHHVHHTYSRIAADLLAHHLQEEPYIHLQQYSNHIIIAVVKAGQLQLIRSFNYQTTEDILYHLLNAARQYQLTTQSVTLNIAGLFNLQSRLHQQLQQLFHHISFGEVPPGSMYNNIMEAGYPAHYFTPFFKLAV